MLSYRYKKHTDNIPADVHYIQWIFVETENGGQIRYLNPGQAPNAVFELGSESRWLLRICNLPWPWMTKL